MKMKQNFSGMVHVSKIEVGTWQKALVGCGSVVRLAAVLWGLMTGDYSVLINLRLANYS